MKSLLGKERCHALNPEQQVFAREEDSGLPLLDVVKKYKPTILLGVTAVGGKIVYV
jgi:malate dehydrogenase (oxaloacetate-decarboxylating)(NADP+)